MAGPHPVVELRRRRRLLHLARRRRVMDGEERRRRRGRTAGAIRQQVLRAVLAVLRVGDPPVNRLETTL